MPEDYHRVRAGHSRRLAARGRSRQNAGMDSKPTAGSVADAAERRKREQQERLAAALRDNLRRRKDQARARREDNGPASAAND
jgi:hypothetical protein